MSNQELEKPSKVSGLLRSSGLISAMTMLSRVLGLIRDMVVANFFGAGAGADVFFLAFKIPNFFRRLFAEGAFAQAFVPVLTE
jgi:putative peptidoglycan lipid II flippase